MPLDNHVWLLLLFNVSFILALSWVSYKFVKHGAHYFKVSECNIGISQDTSSALTILVNWYLIFRRMIKLDTDDDPPHYLLSLQA